MAFRSNEEDDVTTLAGKRIWVAGHNGMVGSAVERRLALEPGVQILHVPRAELDLRDARATRAWALAKNCAPPA